MKAVLYKPDEAPCDVAINEQNVITGRFSNEQVALQLDCAPALVDVLATGEGYIVYSIFDCEAQINYLAMDILTKITGYSFGTDEDNILCGPILVVQNEI